MAIPCMEIQKLAKDVDGMSRFMKVYRLSVFRDGRGLRIPTKWDSSWQGTFPDWDAMDTAMMDRVDSVTEEAIEASGFYASYSGPGRTFSTGPSVRIYRRYVVVTQSVGLDV